MLNKRFDRETLANDSDQKLDMRNVAPYSAQDMINKLGD